VEKAAMQSNERKKLLQENLWRGLLMYLHGTDQRFPWLACAEAILCVHTVWMEPNLKPILKVYDDGM
jgi:hypothetical protein